MDTYHTKPIILSGKPAEKFIKDIFTPDKEYMEYIKRINKMFSILDEEIIITRKGMDIEIEIPKIDLSFIDEIDNL